MAITPMNKQKAVRGSLIDAVDKINEIIAAVNTIDVSAIQQMQSDISALQLSDTNINGRIDGAITRIAACESTDTTQQTDIDNIKITLYTPLSSGENPTTSNGS